MVIVVGVMSSSTQTSARVSGGVWLSAQVRMRCRSVSGIAIATVDATERLGTSSVRVDAEEPPAFRPAARRSVWLGWSGCELFVVAGGEGRASFGEAGELFVVERRCASFHVQRVRFGRDCVCEVEGAESSECFGEPSGRSPETPLPGSSVASQRYRTR